jgi:hypothetical protein
MRHARFLTLVLLPVLFLELAGSPADAESLPRPPCAPGETPRPAYAPAGAPPAVQVWQNVELPADACFGALTGPMNSVAVLAGRFRHPDGAGGTLDDLAARFGAVSQSVGQLYWSTTEQAWRALVSEAFALSGNDTDLKRPDFTAAEVRSGETLYFAQNDTRSTGLNRYRMTALQSRPGRLVVQVVNESPVAFTFVTLFHEEGLLSLHFVERLEDGLWGYYGLAAVREGSVAGHTNSLVNRAAAFYRFLRGVPGDAGPPLAK